MAYDTHTCAAALTDEELFMQDTQSGSPWGDTMPTEETLELMHQEDMAYRRAHDNPAA